MPTTDVCDCCRRGPRVWKLDAPNDHMLHCLYVCDECLARGFDAIKTSIELRMQAAQMRPAVWPGT